MNIEQLVIKNLKTLGLRYHLYSSCTIKLAKKGFCMAACVFILKKYKNMSERTFIFYLPALQEDEDSQV